MRSDDKNPMERKLPEDRRVATRIESGNLVVHTPLSSSSAHALDGIGVTLDLSEFGLKIQCTDPLVLGERFRFSLALGDTVVEAMGQVVHITRIPNNTYEMGIEFVEISVGAIETIRTFLS